MKKSLGATTVVSPAPAWIVGVYDDAGKANGITVAWGGTCCSKPPCVAVSMRKATYSHGCVVRRGAFTVNILSETRAKEVDYFGIASGRDTDKFADTGLTAVKSELVDAPYIEEAPVIIECKLYRTHELGLHTQFVGEIIDVKADESVLTEGGPDMAKVKPLIYNTGTSYYFGIGEAIGKGFSIGKNVKK